MRPREIARPAAAGALCFAFTCAGAQTALAQTDTSTSTPSRPRARRWSRASRCGHRKLDVRAGRRAAGRGQGHARRAGAASSRSRSSAGARWKPIDRDRTDAAGPLPAAPAAPRDAAARACACASREAPGVLPGKRRIGRLNVYRYAQASWYGPGLYGNRTGCGGTLYAGRLGVAHKSLPCGTMVTFKHGRREVRVPVIDRGPYVGGREYDLTEATAQRLGFHGHGAILTTR